jgi:hypothetical protein
VVKPGKAVLKLNVPYVHQVIDIDTADGNWACGPTSVVMVLAYYGKLPTWHDYLAQHPDASPTLPAIRFTDKPAATATRATAAKGNAARPGKATATPTRTPFDPEDYAPYITNIYTNNGHTYSAQAADPDGNHVAGLYGTICPAGLADWGKMAAVFQWHGLSSRAIGISFDSIVAALKRNHPVLIGNGLTSVGHILVAVGYTDNGQLIVNDPYGDRFEAGYGGNNGEGRYYLYSCMRIKNALEVIGTYPPPATATPTITATAPPAANPAPGAPAASIAAAGATSTPGPGVYSATLLPGEIDSAYVAPKEDNSEGRSESNAVVRAYLSGPISTLASSYSPTHKDADTAKWLLVPVLATLAILLAAVARQRLPRLPRPRPIPVAVEDAPAETTAE